MTPAIVLRLAAIADLDGVDASFRKASGRIVFTGPLVVTAPNASAPDKVRAVVFTSASRLAYGVHETVDQVANLLDARSHS